MIKKIKLGTIDMILTTENSDVRVKSNHNNILLANQSVNMIANILQQNFDIVHGFYETKISNKSKQIIGNDDLNQISINILLHYLALYNQWNNSYNRNNKYDLKFHEEDFNNHFTWYRIIYYFQNKYPNDWEDKCRRLIGMTQEEFKDFYIRSENYFNK